MANVALDNLSLRVVSKLLLESLKMLENRMLFADHFLKVTRSDYFERNY
jgi:hypothetical protein